jgi:hypothetical protein
MLVGKLALITCAFYLGVAFLIEGAWLVAAQLLGGIGVTISRVVWGSFFAVVWLASFLAAWQIVIVPTLSRSSR